MVGPCKSPRSLFWQPEAVGIAGAAVISIYAAEVSSGRAGSLIQGKPMVCSLGVVLGGLQLSVERPRSSL